MFNGMASSGNFKYNSMLASALAQLLPAQERKVIRSWIDRLHSITDTEQMPNRNDYMWFLLLALKNRRITRPFNAMPYEGDLVPLKDLLPNQIYTDVVNQAAGEANLAWIDHLMQHGTSGPDGGQPHHPGGCTAPPSQFLQYQPIPKRGIMCYMGAFSDQKNIF